MATSLLCGFTNELLNLPAKRSHGFRRQGHTSGSLIALDDVLFFSPAKAVKAKKLPTLHRLQGEGREQKGLLCTAEHKNALFNQHMEKKTSLRQPDITVE